MTTPHASAPELGQTRPQDGPRQLRRSRRDHVVGGVCGGLGHYFDVDPLVFRIAFVAMTLAGGSGVLLYIIGWVAVPESDYDEISQVAPRSVSGSQAILGAALVLVGAALLAGQLLPGLDRFFWPLLLMALGAVVLLRGDQR